MVVRTLLSKVGRAQKACDLEDLWSDHCVGDCLSSYASLSYEGAAYSTATTVWMGGPNGSLVMSPDSGINWVVRDSNTTTDIMSLVFVSEKVGFAVGAGAGLGKTVDGGASWIWRRDLSDKRENKLHGVHFVDEQYGWVVGSSSRIYRTVDGGASWEVETWESGRTFRGVHFASPSVGVVVGDEGFVIWSADGGKTWEVKNINSRASMRAAHCVNATHAFVAGYLGMLWRTRDGGVTWQRPAEAKTSMYFLGVGFAPGGLNGWAVGQQRMEPPAAAPGLLLSTTDGGDTWTEDRRARLLTQRLNGVATFAVDLPACPTTSWDPNVPRTTTTRTTTTRNALALAVKEKELELLSLLTSGVNETQLVENTPVATVTAQLLNVTDAVGGYVAVQAANSTVQVRVPVSALAGFEDQNPVLLLSAFYDTAANWDANPDAQLAMESEIGQAMASPPITINLAVAGAFVDVTGLKDPIVFKLTDTRTEGYTCAFWNETLKQWDNTGMNEIIDSDGGLSCATVHLTTFASVFREVLAGFEQALKCTNVGSVSPEGLANLAEGMACVSENCVWKNPAFYVFWAIVFFQGWIFSWAWRHDRRWRTAGLWHKSCWLVSNFQFVTPHKPLKETIKEKLKEGVGMAATPGSSLSLFASTTVVQHAVASRLRISVGDLQILLEWAKKTITMPEDVDMEDIKQRKKWAKELKATHKQAKLIAFVPNIYRCMDEQVKVYQDMMSTRGTRFTLLRYIFIAQHPWLKMSHFSALKPAREQALMLNVKVFGSMWAAAIWFQGDSSGYVDDPECATSESIVVMIARAVAVSFLSLFFAAMPELVMSVLSSRKFLYKNEWTPEDIQAQYRTWQKQRLAFWVLGLFVVFFGIIFCTSFLANVTSADGLRWLLSSVIMMCKISLLKPLGMGAGFLFLGLCSVSKYSDPLLQRKAREQLCLGPDQELEEKLGEQHMDDHAALALQNGGEGNPSAIGSPGGSPGGPPGGVKASRQRRPSFDRTAGGALRSAGAAPTAAQGADKAALGGGAGESLGFLRAVGL